MSSSLSELFIVKLMELANTDPNDDISLYRYYFAAALEYAKQMTSAYHYSLEDLEKQFKGYGEEYDEIIDNIITYIKAGK